MVLEGRLAQQRERLVRMVEWSFVFLIPVSVSELRPKTLLEQ